MCFRDSKHLVLISRLLKTTCQLASAANIRMWTQVSQQGVNTTLRGIQSCKIGIKQSVLGGGVASFLSDSKCIMASISSTIFAHWCSERSASRTGQQPVYVVPTFAGHEKYCPSNDDAKRLNISHISIIQNFLRFIELNQIRFNIHLSFLRVIITYRVWVKYNLFVAQPMNWSTRTNCLFCSVTALVLWSDFWSKIFGNKRKRELKAWYYLWTGWHSFILLKYAEDNK